MFVLITYASNVLTTPKHDLRYYLMNSIIPAISELLILGNMSGSFYSSSSFFCSASRCTVSSCFPIIFQSKVHLHLWWNRMAANFRFSWAMIDTFCPLLGIPQALLPPGFLIAVAIDIPVHENSQPLMTVTPCFLMSNLTNWDWFQAKCKCPVATRIQSQVLILDVHAGSSA